MGGGSIFLCERYAGAVLLRPVPDPDISLNGSQENSKASGPTAYLKDVRPQGRKYNGFHKRLLGGTKACHIVPCHLTEGIAENRVAVERTARDGRDGNASSRDISSAPACPGPHFIHT